MIAGMEYNREPSLDQERSWQSGNAYDPQVVKFYDIAQEGAQVRSIAEHISAGVLLNLDGFLPRSVTVVSRDQISTQAAHLALSLFEPLPMPVCVTTQVPGFVGPLDVIVAVTEKRVDDHLSEQLLSASARGAVVVLAAGGKGPLMQDASDDAVVFPVLPLAEGISPARGFAAVYAVLAMLRAGQTKAVEVLREIADQVDAELENCSPQRDESLNPAAQLAHLTTGHAVIHSGVGATFQAMAALITPLWAAAGFECTFLEYDSMLAAWPHLEQRRSQGVRDIFYDPFLDGPANGSANDPETGDVLGDTLSNSVPMALPLRRMVWGDPNSAEALGIDVSSAEGADPASALRLVTRGFAATVFF